MHSKLFLTGGVVAAAFIAILVCGALDGLSRLNIFRSRSSAQVTSTQRGEGRI